MNIRPARPQDAAALAAIWNPVIRDTALTFNSVEWSVAGLADMIAAKAAAGHGFLVSDAAAGPNGFASYGQFRAGTGYAGTMEHTIILAPEAHGRGIGRALLAALEDHARTAGVHCLIAGISAENPGGIGFHAHLGFAAVAIMPEVGFKFGRRFDLVLMQKFL